MKNILCSKIVYNFCVSVQPIFSKKVSNFYFFFKNDQKSSWGGWEESCIISIFHENMGTNIHGALKHRYFLGACLLLAACLSCLAAATGLACPSALFQKSVAKSEVSFSVVSEICGKE